MSPHQSLYDAIHGHQAGQLLVLAAEDPDPEELVRLDAAIADAIAALEVLPDPDPADLPALAALAHEAHRLSQAVAEATRQRSGELKQDQAGMARNRDRLGGYLPQQHAPARYIDRKG